MNLKKIVNFKKRGLPQKEIAKILGVTQQAISLYIVKARKLGLWNDKEGEKI